MASVGFGICLFQRWRARVWACRRNSARSWDSASCFGEIPAPVIVTAALIVIMYVLLNWTRLGRYLYAVGGNSRRRRCRVLNTRLTLFLAYVLCGGMTAVSGIMNTARLDSGEANIGASLVLESIAACVIAA